jgi:hypothetical protein
MAKQQTIQENLEFVTITRGCLGKSLLIIWAKCITTYREKNRYEKDLID